jgi:DNA-binding NtrC family response regulator
VGIVSGKRHIRKFLEEALEKLGFTTRECTQVDELSAVLDGQAPDLVIAGLLSNDALISALFEKQMDQCNA